MSCSQENLLIPDTETTAQETPASTKITLPEALKNAESAFGMLDLNTRAIRIPESVEYIGANYQTRSSSSNEDVKYYIVNYADNQGFAVLSADAEKGKVFALSDEGSISLSDTIDNPGLGVFFNKLNKWIDIPLDTTLTVTPKDTTPALPYPFISKVSPRMPKNVQNGTALEFSAQTSEIRFFPDVTALRHVLRFLRHSVTRIIGESMVFRHTISTGKL